MTFRVAVLTVSDTASKDASSDKSGPLIQELLGGKGYQVVNTAIVPDEVQQIREIVLSWIISGTVDWVITTGGTGFGVRDRTPEAIKPLLEREAPGIVHLLLSTSLQHTPLGALSRPVAGTSGSHETLIVTLPGSSKAVKECLDALLGSGVIEHALELLGGGTGRGVHLALSKSISEEKALDRLNRHTHEHSCVHHEDRQTHGHKHIHGEVFSAAKRHRISPYALVSFETALELIFRHIKPTETVKNSVTHNLRGTVLAEDVHAPQDVPASPTTNMDGYALRSSDVPGLYRVVTPQTHPLDTHLPKGCIYRINTGAPLPAGTDSVVIVEDTELVISTADGEEAEVRTLKHTSPGENVRSPGSDVRRGDLVLTKGEILHGTGGEIGTLAFVGRKEVLIHRKPVVAIMSTGNELADLHDSTSNKGDSHQASKENWSGIWDTNRPSLRAALETLGYEVIDLGIVKDDIRSHVEAVRDGIYRADIVLTTGGTSMGASDLLKPVIEKNLNGTIHFGRVTIKPGKPTTFATIPAVTDVGSKLKPIFALPGNPASALVCFYIFVVPALRRLGGWPEKSCQLSRIKVQIQDSMRLDPRTEFHRVIISAGSSGLIARSTGGQRSSRVASMSGANGLVILPQKWDNGPTELKEGELADAILMGDILVE